MDPSSVLVVEDDRATRNALKRFFQLKGWEVRLASTVAEGLAMLEPPPDCVLLDLMLPDGGGEAILRKIRADRLPIRVAVCTGSHDPDRLGVLAALGPDFLLRKPVGLAEITEACGCGPGRRDRSDGALP